MAEEKITVNYKKYFDTLTELFRYRQAEERGEGNGKGKWEYRVVDLEEAPNAFMTRRWYCSHCGEHNTYGATPYCPYCGAKMEEYK